MALVHVQLKRTHNYDGNTDLNTASEYCDRKNSESYHSVYHLEYLLCGKLATDSTFNPKIGICTNLFMMPHVIVASLGPLGARVSWARAHRLRDNREDAGRFCGS